MLNPIAIGCLLLIPIAIGSLIVKLFMSVSLKSFFVKLASFSIITFGILFLFQHYASARFQTDLFWAIWLFFIATTALIHFVLMKAASQDPKKFITYFMGITGIKLFSYLLIIIIYGLVNRESASGFIMCFLFSYFLYSGFEVVTLLKHFKK